MRNAKKEFIEEIDGKVVLCARLYRGLKWDEDEQTVYRLPRNFGAIELSDFIESLDFSYDDGFGGQELFGFIWYADGTWSERREYDGAEWWEYQKCPQIPEDVA